MNEAVVETVKGWCPAEMGVKQKEGGFGKHMIASSLPPQPTLITQAFPSPPIQPLSRGPGTYILSGPGVRSLPSSHTTSNDVLPLTSASFHKHVAFFAFCNIKISWFSSRSVSIAINLFLNPPAHPPNCPSYTYPHSEHVSPLRCLQP